MKPRALLGALILSATLGALATPAFAKPVIGGTDKIVQTTKTKRAGSHPILRWKKARGATQYLVVVQTPDKKPYWTWQGTTTNVRLGGGPSKAPATSDGASLTTKLFWFVIALDAEGTAVASSERRPITP